MTKRVLITPESLKFIRRFPPETTLAELVKARGDLQIVRQELHGLDAIQATSDFFTQGNSLELNPHVAQDYKITSNAIQPDGTAYLEERCHILWQSGTSPETQEETTQKIRELLWSLGWEVVQEGVDDPNIPM